MKCSMLRYSISTRIAQFRSNQEEYQWRRQVFKSGGMISDFKKNTENILRANARERRDQARGSEATERGEGEGGVGVSPLRR